MVKGIEGILLSSENAEKLATFYKDVVGLKQAEEFEMGEAGEKAFSFDVGSISFVIMDHSEVKGKNKNPERILFNIEVDDVEKEFERLSKENVEVKQEIYHVEGYGMIATFVDPDGNFFQFVQIRATN